MPSTVAASVLVLACVWSVCCVQECLCFSNGSVAFSCSSMMPGHPPYTPSSSPPPYTLSASTATYRPGGIITVTMETEGKSSRAFRGFMLQARSCEGQGAVSGLWPVGRFTNLNTTLFTGLDCEGIESSTVSQVSPTQKTRVEVNWEAPSNSSYGDIYFSATFVQDYTTFWVQVNSSTLRLDSTGNPSGSAARVISSLTGLSLSLLSLNLMVLA